MARKEGTKAAHITYHNIIIVSALFALFLRWSFLLGPSASKGSFTFAFRDLVEPAALKHCSFLILLL